MRSVSIEGLCLSEADIQDLLPPRLLERITQVDLSDNPSVGGKTLQYLAEHCRSLEVLHLSGNDRVLDPDMGWNSSISDFPTLQKLYLKRTSITEKRLDRMIHSIACFKRIQKLDLTKSSQLTRLPDSMYEMKGLTPVNLSFSVAASQGPIYDHNLEGGIIVRFCPNLQKEGALLQLSRELKAHPLFFLDKGDPL